MGFQDDCQKLLDQYLPIDTIHSGGTMSKIDDIRQAMAKKDEHEQEMRVWASAVAVHLADGFREDVGLPKMYSSFNGAKKPYVDFIKVDLENEGLADDAKHVSEAITIFYDGSIHFGLGVTLDLGEETFPKRRFTFYIVCQIEGAELAVSISKHPVVRCTKSETPSGYDMQPAYNALYEIIMNHLNSRVGDDRYQKKIGFGIRPA